MIGRLLKWSVELGQYDIIYSPRNAIKDQELVDFIVECTRSSETKVNNTPETAHKWKHYVDGASNKQGVRISYVLITPNNIKLYGAI